MTMRVWELSVEELAEVGRKAAGDAVTRQKRAGMTVDVTRDIRRGGGGGTKASSNSATITITFGKQRFSYPVSIDSK